MAWAGRSTAGVETEAKRTEAGEGEAGEGDRFGEGTGADLTASTLPQHQIPPDRSGQGEVIGRYSQFFYKAVDRAAIAAYAIAGLAVG